MRCRSSIILGCVLMTLAAATAASAAPAASAPSSTCTGAIQITALGFHPPTVAPGASSTVRLTAQNCRHHARSATLTWLAHFAGSNGGIPTGCPAIDPLAVPAQFAADGAFRASLRYLAFPGCTATTLVVTARLTSSTGTVLAHRSATLHIT